MDTANWVQNWTRLFVFHIALITMKKVWTQLTFLLLWVNSRAEWVLLLWNDNRSSSLLLFSQRSDMFSGHLQVFIELGKSTRNFELCPLLNPGVLYSNSVSHNRVQVYSCIVTCMQSGSNLQPPDHCLLRSLANQRL